MLLEKINVLLLEIQQECCWVLLRSTWALGVALQNRWGCGDAGGAELLEMFSPQGC